MCIASPSFCGSWDSATEFEEHRRGDFRGQGSAPAHQLTEANRGLNDREDRRSGTLHTTYSSLPGALISAQSLSDHGWQAAPSGRWLVQSSKPFTATQLSTARGTAARFGLNIESRDEQQGLVNLRRGAMAAGMLLALSVLAMTVGLIRSETSRFAHLTATGASSFRRAITATTSGWPALLGVGLGIVGAYATLVAGRLKDLTPLPLLDLVVIAVVLRSQPRQ